MDDSKENLLVSELAKLIRSKGDKIFEGTVRLSVTTSLISYVFEKVQKMNLISSTQPNEQFDVLNRRLDHSQQNENDLLFLHDLFQLVRSMKIFHGNSTLQGGINLQKLYALKELEIKRVPIHLLLGLSVLRGKLEVLIVCRCHFRLEDLLCYCGGDNSPPENWCFLRELHLVHNQMEGVDPSLRLLPALQVLDMSHNGLRRTGEHLKCFKTLTHLNLNFNVMERFPLFSIHSSLVDLCLRGNRLEDVEGVQVLECLEQLDVAENLLANHEKLLPLLQLKKLKKLILESNPLCFHPNHRTSTVKYLSRSVFRAKFLLDGRLLSSQERAMVGLVQDRVESNHRSHHEPPALLVNDGADGDVNDSPLLSRSGGKQQRRRKPKRPNARQVVISEDGESDFLTSQETLETDHVNMAEVKRELEAARSTFKEQWLLARPGGGGLGEAKMASSSVPNVSRRAESTTTTTTTTTTTKRHAVAISTSSIAANGHADSNWLDGDKETATNNMASSPYSWREVQESAIDMGEVKDTFIVENVDQDQPILLSVTDQYLIEKSLNNEVILWTFELKAMTFFQIKDEDGDIVIHLKFDYFNPRKRERKFRVDDEEDRNKLVSYLREAMSTNATDKQQKAEKHYKCLKCKNVFRASQAGQKLKEEAPPMFVIGSFGSLKTKGAFVQVDVCPKCHEDVLIEQDPETTPVTYLSFLQPHPQPKAVVPASVSALPAQAELQPALFRDNSDITLLPSPSQASITVLEEQHASSDDDEDEARNPFFAPDEDVSSPEPSTPLGSLPKSVCSNIASSMYEESLGTSPPKGAGQRGGSQEELPSRKNTSPERAGSRLDDLHTSTEVTWRGMHFDFAHWDKIDHRLKLHCIVTIFGEDEQIKGAMMIRVLASDDSMEPQLLVLSNEKLYFFRVREDTSGRTDGANDDEDDNDVVGNLELSQTLSLSDLVYIDIGLNYQYFRLEFIKKHEAIDDVTTTAVVSTASAGTSLSSSLLSAFPLASSLSKSNTNLMSTAATKPSSTDDDVTVVFLSLRDEGRGQLFYTQFTTLINTCLDASQLKQIRKSGHLLRTLLEQAAGGELIVWCWVQFGYDEFASLVVSTYGEILLIGGCLAALAHNSEARVKVIQRRMINEISSVMLSKSEPLVTFNFFHDSTGSDASSSIVVVVMETMSPIPPLLRAIEPIWRNEFDLDLDIQWLDT